MPTGFYYFFIFKWTSASFCFGKSLGVNNDIIIVVGTYMETAVARQNSLFEFRFVLDVLFKHLVIKIVIISQEINLIIKYFI